MRIKDPLKKILKEAKEKKAILEEFKPFFSSQEYKHIVKFRAYKDRLIFYVDSPLVLYHLNLKREDFVNKAKERGFIFSSVIFKM